MKARRYDFVSRYFAPAKRIPEDPFTGAVRCMLTPCAKKRWSFRESRLSCFVSGHGFSRAVMANKDPGFRWDETAGLTGS
jgi:predicted PhzF superfamily epimerase YddE/YHI9